jgi:hypothetical protein
VNVLQGGLGINVLHFFVLKNRNVFSNLSEFTIFDHQSLDPDPELDLDPYSNQFGSTTLILRQDYFCCSIQEGAGAAEDPDGPCIVERDPRDALAPLGRQHLQERLHRLQRLGPHQWQTAL